MWLKVAEASGKSKIRMKHLVTYKLTVGFVSSYVGFVAKL